MIFYSFMLNNALVVYATKFNYMDSPLATW